MATSGIVGSPARVLVAGLSSALLGDIVRRLGASEPGIEIVEQLDEARGLESAIERHRPDVLVFALEDEEVPAGCRELLARYPDLALVGLADDGRMTSLYVQDAGVEELFSAVRAAAGLGRDRVR